MSPDELPEDISLWPENIYDLFDLSPEFTQEDLKRHYNLLIRRFRPEHSPQAFKRIRESYEFFLRLTATVIPIFQRIDITRDISSDSKTAPPKPSEANSSDKSESGKLQNSSSENPAVDYWQMAIDGLVREAYVGLNQMVHKEISTPETFAQLYWLELLYPEIEKQNSAPQRLCEGIQKFGWVQPLQELLRKEIAVNPKIVLQPDYVSLNQSASAVKGANNWYELRFRALAAIPDLKQMHIDLDELQNRHLDFDDDTYFSILCRMCDYAAWSNETDSPNTIGLLNKIFARLDSFEVNAKRTNLHDRCESLLRIYADWIKLRGKIKSVPFLFRILGDDWIDGRIGYTYDWYAFLNSVDLRISPWLETLDSIANISPIFPQMLYKGLQSESMRCNKFGCYIQSRRIAEEMNRHLDRLNLIYDWKTSVDIYLKLRQSFFDISVVERIPFDWVIRAFREAAEERKWEIEAFMQRLEEDWPVRCISIAYRLAGLL